MCIKKINDEEVTTIEKESLSELNAIVTPEGVTIEPFTSQYEAENAEFLAKYDTDEKQINYYTQEMYNLLDDFQIDYGSTEDGCRANVKEWYYEKKPLFNLLRKHPMWDERAKAIVFLKTENRGIDIRKFIDDFTDLNSFVTKTNRKSITEKYKLDHPESTYLSLRNLTDFINNTENRTSTIDSMIRHINSHPEKITNQFLSKDLATYINDRIKQDNGKAFCQAGEKLSRVINKIYTEITSYAPSYKSYESYTQDGAYDDIKPEELSVMTNYHYRHLDCCASDTTANAELFKLDATKFKDDETGESYNKLFAKLADDINPMSVERITCLSVNILDFLLMSYGNSWASCHYINSHNYKLNLKNGSKSYNGCYKAGTLSYSNDDVSMIFYTISDKYAGTEYYNEPKINRQIFCYNSGTLMQSRLYPATDNTQLSEQYRALVQSIIAFCESKPNLWLLSRSNGKVCHWCYANDDFSTYMYHDWERTDWGANISHLKEYYYHSIIIGGRSYCVDCGCLKDDDDDNENLQCHSCTDENIESCYNCDCSIDTERDTFIEYNGHYYCEDCYFYCDYHNCNEPNTDGINRVREDNGNIITVCDDTIDEGDYVYCYSCDCYTSVDDCITDENGNNYCHSCADNLLTECYECGEFVRNYDIHYDEHHHSLCDHCYEEIEEENPTNESED